MAGFDGERSFSHLDRPLSGGSLFDDEPDYLDYDYKGRPYHEKLFFNSGLAYLSGRSVCLLQMPATFAVFFFYSGSTFFFYSPISSLHLKYMKLEVCGLTFAIVLRPALLERCLGHLAGWRQLPAISSASG